jgi:hypothetical protein
VTDNPDDYPGLEPAQAFVLPSYQWMLTRIEAADSRIHSLVAFVLTVTAGVPTVSRAFRPNLPFDSGWFAAAIGVAAVILVVGVLARAYGTIMLPDPAKVYEKWLDFPVWEFQKRALHFAGQHLEANRNLVKVKSYAVVALTALFAGEVGLLLTWLRCG